MAENKFLGKVYFYSEKDNETEILCNYFCMSDYMDFIKNNKIDTIVFEGLFQSVEIKSSPRMTVSFKNFSCSSLTTFEENFGCIDQDLLSIY